MSYYLHVSLLLDFAISTDASCYLISYLLKWHCDILYLLGWVFWAGLSARAQVVSNQQLSHAWVSICFCGGAMNWSLSVRSKESPEANPLS